MSKPAPLSRTRKTVSPSCRVEANSMHALGWLRVNFQALARRFSSTMARSRLSPVAVRLGGLEPLGCRAGQIAQVDRLASKVTTGDAGQRKQALDELRHALRRFAHTSQVALSIVVELGGILLKEGLAEAVDAAQGCAEIVRHRIAESLELTVGGVGRLLRADHGLLCALAIGNVSRDLRRTDHLTTGIVNRGYCHGHVNVLPILPATYCFKGFDALASLEPLHDRG